jgi:hypothetical protein
MLSMPFNRTAIPGLYCVGDSTFPGQGVNAGARWRRCCVGGQGKCCLGAGMPAEWASQHRSKSLQR